jgi:hypothetical protein
MASELSVVEQTILAGVSVEALAEALLISHDDACDLLFRANEAGRVEIKGNDHIAGVMLDDQWVVIRGRDWLRRAPHEYATLRFMERQFED